jgi:hypothetical protein
MFLMGGAALAADEDPEATGRGLYLGAGASRIHLTGTSGNLEAERNSAAKVFLGYQFRPPVALEATYAWCGTVRAPSSSVTGGPSETFHIRALTFQVVGTFLRVENIALQGRIGGVAWRAFPGTQTGYDEKGLGIATGVSLKFDIGKNVAVRADFDMYRTSLENIHFRWAANVSSVNIIGSFH